MEWMGERLELANREHGKILIRIRWNSPSVLQNGIGATVKIANDLSRDVRQDGLKRYYRLMCHPLRLAESGRGIVAGRVGGSNVARGPPCRFDGGRGGGKREEGRNSEEDVEWFHEKFDLGVPWRRLERLFDGERTRGGR